MFHYALESKNSKKAVQVMMPFYEKSEKELEKLLTAKDLYDETPLHKLVQQQHADSFNDVFKHLSKAGVDILGCMQIGNAAKMTPLHIAAQCGLRSFMMAVLKFDANRAEEVTSTEKKTNSQSYRSIA